MQSPFSPFRQRLFEYGQPYQQLVDRAVRGLGDPFIEGEVLQFQQLTQELLEAHQEVVDARAEVCHTQQVKMLATSTLVAMRQAIDASAARFKQAGAYQPLHPHLVRQSLRHISDNDAIIEIHDHLYCQLQAGGRPLSPEVSEQESPHNLDTLLARFDNTPMSDRHNKPFFQDRGDADNYCE